MKILITLLLISLVSCHEKKQPVKLGSNDYCLDGGQMDDTDHLFFRDTAIELNSIVFSNCKNYSINDFGGVCVAYKDTVWHISNAERAIEILLEIQKTIDSSLNKAQQKNYQYENIIREMYDRAQNPPTSL